jgi:hypothetical protein
MQPTAKGIAMTETTLKPEPQSLTWFSKIVTGSAPMKNIKLCVLTVAAVALVSASAKAAPVSASAGDLILGFRTANTPGNTLNLEIDLGSIATFEAVSPGGTLDLTSRIDFGVFAEIYGAIWATRNDLFWAAAGVYSTSTVGSSGGYTNPTIWVTDYAGDANIPQRRSASLQSGTAVNINSVRSFLNGVESTGTVYMAAIDSTLANSWEKRISPGGSGSDFGYFVEAEGAVGATTTLDLYRLTPGSGAGTKLGTLTLSGNSLTFQAVSGPSYPVIYNANGATSGTVPGSQTKTYNVTLTLATNSGNLAWDGHTFAGWNTATDGTGTDYAAGGSYTANASVTLYAKWTSLPIPTWQVDALSARTDGRQQLLWRHLSIGVPDGQVSLWTLNTNASLQATATYGPYSGWTVADMLVSRQANTPHLIWTNTSGAISIWNFDSSGAFQTAQTHGPFTGWSYHSAAFSPTNTDQWVLWKYTDGQVSLWRLNSNSVYQSSQTFGPFTGWSAEELAVSPANGKVRLLWKNTDGSVSLWRMSNTGGFEVANMFGPYAGWTAQTVTVGPSDNKVRILWEHTDGAIAVWRLTTADDYEASMTYGPFSGWLTLGMVMRPDNKLQLPWDHTSDHAFSLWRLDSAEGYEGSNAYGPYPSWQVFNGDVDGADKSHILWRKTDGSISLWRLSPTGDLENAANFGPY